MIFIRLALIGGLFVCSVWLHGCDNGSIACVAEGSFIATPDGVALVETLKIGDFVLSVDPNTGRMYPARIIGIRSTERGCFPLSVHNGNTLWLTAEHPVYDPGSGFYREARQWLKGDVNEVLTIGSDGQIIQHATASNLETKHTRVYDISVDSPHRNFVANGILVHNKSFPPPLPEIPGNYTGWVIATQQSDTGDVVITDSLPIQATFLSDNSGLNGEYSISPFNSVLDSIPPEPCFWDGGKWFMRDGRLNLIPLDTIIIPDTVMCIQSIVPFSLIGTDTVSFSVTEIGSTFFLSQLQPKNNLTIEFTLTRSSQ